MLCRSCARIPGAFIFQTGSFVTLALRNFWLVLGLMAVPATAAEQTSYFNGTLSFVLENDLLYNADRHYTNGVHLSWLADAGAEPQWATDAARRLPLFADSEDLRVELALGQNMYTPRDIRRRETPPDDRPYAGWLYGTVGIIAETRQHLDQLQVGLGVVGPASLGEQTQKFVHTYVGSPEPQGWDSQIRNEPTLQAAFQRSWRYRTATGLPGFDMDAIPHAGANVGNALTYANGGLMLRLGYNIPKDYGPPRIQPSLPGSGYFEPIGQFGFYVFAGVDGRAVGRNIFLDGNLLADSRNVEKRPLVGDVQLGVAVVWLGVRMAYTHVRRSQEFDGQEQPDRFGALSISYRF